MPASTEASTSRVTVDLPLPLPPATPMTKGLFLLLDWGMGFYGWAERRRDFTGPCSANGHSLSSGCLQNVKLKLQGNILGEELDVGNGLQHVVEAIREAVHGYTDFASISTVSRTLTGRSFNVSTWEGV